jgi:Zn-dependent protease
MFFIWIILPLLLLFPMFWCIRVLAVYRAVSGVRFGRTGVEPVRSENFPYHVREALERYLKQLDQLGFSCRQIWCQRPQNLPEFDCHEVEFARADGVIRVVLRGHPSANRSGELLFRFFTTLSDGYELVTTPLESEEILPPSRAFIAQVMPEARFEDAFAAHQKKLAELAAEGRTAVPLPADVAVQRLQLLIDDEFDAAAAAGLIVPAEKEGQYRVHGLKAFPKSIELLRKYRARSKAESAGKRFRMPLQLSAQAQSEFDYEHLRQMRALRKGGFSLKIKTAIALASMALFTLALGGTLGWEAGVTLLLTILVHEAGHIVAMRCFGHKDTQIVFIPFFGAAAVGNDDVTLKPWQSVVVSLAGPLPGIFIGLGMLVASLYHEPASVLLMPAFIVIVVNAINLLPILPLDGGHVFDASVASRFPRARVLFLLFSAIGTIGFALLGGGSSMLLVVGVMAIWRLAAEKRLADLEVELRRDLPEQDERSVLTHMLARMREENWAKLQNAQRLVLASNLWNRVRKPLPGFGTAAFALSAYLSPLWLALPLAAAAYLGSANVRMDAARQKLLAAAIAPLPAPMEVPETGNAAMLLNKLPLSREKIDELNEEEEDDEIAMLLEARPTLVAQIREAAACPVFVAPADLSTVDSGIYDRAVELLAVAARKSAEGGKLQEAQEILVDAFKLERLLRNDPRVWQWSNHQHASVQLWSAAHEVIRQSAGCSPELLAQLASYIDEAAELALAEARLPVDELTQLAQTEALITAGNDSSGLLASALHLFARQAQVESYTLVAKKSVRLKALLAEVKQGRWPGIPAVEEADVDEFAAAMDVSELAEFLAYLRAIKIGLAVQWQLATTGKTPAELGDLAVPWCKNAGQHPRTGAGLQWVNTGDTLKISFPPSTDSGVEESEVYPPSEYGPWEVSLAPRRS